MADPGNDPKFDQMYLGEYCNLFIGSFNQTPKGYYAYLSSFNRTGFTNEFGYEKTMGTTMLDRKGMTPGKVSFNVVFVGSELPNLTNMTQSTPSAGFTDWKLTENDKRFKIRMEFMESNAGSLARQSGTAGSMLLSDNDVGYKEVYYNARNVLFDIKVDAKRYSEGTISFFVSPYNDVGSSNFRSLFKAATKSIAGWTTHEIAWDTDMVWSSLYIDRA